MIRCSATSDFTRRRISLRDTASSELNGSSSSKMRGEPANARANATRWRSPPLSDRVRA